jgi:hypothetical protein
MLARKASVSLIFGFLLIAPWLWGVQKQYTTGKFLAVEQKSRDKVDMYLVNTPVTTAVPYFEISVELGDTDYLAEYTPRHSAEELPEAWRPGESVPARIEKHHLFLKRSDGTEMEWIITKRTPVSKDKEKSQQ